MLDSAYTSAKLNGGEVTNYGFGWSIGEDQGRLRVSHGGAWVGFRTHIARYLEDSVTIVVLSNFGRANPGRVSRQVANLVFSATVADQATGERD